MSTKQSTLSLAFRFQHNQQRNNFFRANDRQKKKKKKKKSPKSTKFNRNKPPQHLVVIVNRDASVAAQTGETRKQLIVLAIS
jgi:hypothetical protein